MNKTSTRIAVSALGILAMSGAQASIITAGASGGSEAVLTLTNSSNATITQDLGEQIAQIASGDSYTLSSAVQSFITAAGGLANVTYAIIAGSTTARTYLTTTADSSLKSVDIANSERNVWAGTLNGLLPTLNSGDASATSVNNTYGPFASGAAGNYLDGGYDLWNGNYVVNTGAGDTDLILYKVVFGTNNLQNATIAHLFGDNPENADDYGNSYARLGLTSLQIGPANVVPVPAAVWLFGSSIGLLGALRRRFGA